ncbi:MULTISPECIES: FKBP-type peptidyl-prolyl cis-trans isomerase [Photorhabdus]|uniref:Peptidyl-prolyl cis-trans isomerase n=2 Tax=Photorhabdus TaxID=29487 RepID=A0ABX0B3I8_9GAMM|nr:MULTISPECIES: FKBP-type peptidyl-prolyl cis-trans isomerase [Photorhabdus]MCC8372855.1 FKBP-type peptidyl-prolyl cis-trans isomerase [Photorhabdus bodei]MCC8463335.1 FKBP-type peptidyl-prolyl cis-trans isomerase [Photorhabdus bodei]MCT8350687.1 FKBP-type peptidyl-prolyl cis-trans isomerase [Photorhabdus kayaii]MDB6368380.1 FKBP-type peptidyl-prolyl cis-trans isomerase [Photorhabdus bodei]MDB6371982.1 FKBP-type peptidyl-prolyl cis-trans isomerase [Photorhabdus bodei]
MSNQVQANSAVLLHFTLKLQDGSIVDSTHTQGKPALFRLGDGTLSSPLEQQLTGLKDGDKHTFTLAGENVFGKPNPDLIQYFTPRDFAETGIPEIGTIMLFTAMNGSEMPGIVKAVTEESVTVDFNHPLAEQNVTFEIEVLEIDPRLEENHADIAG